MNIFSEADHFPFEQGWKQGFVDLALSLRDYGLIVAANLCLIGIVCSVITLPQPYLIVCLALGFLWSFEQLKKVIQLLFSRPAMGELVPTSIRKEIELSIDAEYVDITESGEEDEENELQEQRLAGEKKIKAIINQYYEEYLSGKLREKASFRFPTDSTDAAIIDVIKVISILIHERYPTSTDPELLMKLMHIRNKLEMLLYRRSEEGFKGEAGELKTPKPKRIE
jgi:hypothetical protein